jgi:hypothetical protein
MWMPVFTSLFFLSFLPRGRANEQCLEMYRTAFKGKAPVKPADVGSLYLTYCKKNMRVGSAKSMDELCQPIVKKVEDKMVWVPPDVEVTPDLVCKTMDQIKEAFPEHAALMADGEATRKQKEDVEEAKKKELAAKAKTLGSKIEQEVVDVFKKAGESMSKDLSERIKTHAKEVLGGEFDARKEKMVKKILESITLGMRGLETKTKQKADESLKEWAALESKELVKMLKEDAKKAEL